MSHKNEPKLGRQHVYQVLHKENKEQSCGSFGQTVSEEKILKKITHQKQELPIAAMFLTEGVTMSNLYRGLLYMLPTKLHFIFYKHWSFCLDPLKNVATADDSWFSLVNF
jgi:hypothetical protein